LHEGEYNEALKFGKSLEEKYSQDPDYLFIMGSAYYILEEAKKALGYFDKVLEINEFDKETLLLKANIHLYQKETEPAIDCCNKIIQVDPKNKQAQAILDHLN